MEFRTGSGLLAVVDEAGEPFRRSCLRLVESNYFELFITTVIVVNVVVIGVDVTTNFRDVTESARAHSYFSS